MEKSGDDRICHRFNHVYTRASVGCEPQYDEDQGQQEHTEMILSPDCMMNIAGPDATQGGPIANQPSDYPGRA